MRPSSPASALAKSSAIGGSQLLYAVSQLALEASVLDKQLLNPVAILQRQCFNHCVHVPRDGYRLYLLLSQHQAGLGVRQALLDLLAVGNPPLGHGQLVLDDGYRLLGQAILLAQLLAHTILLC